MRTREFDIEQIVREVVRRLRELEPRPQIPNATAIGERAQSGNLFLSEKLITLRTLTGRLNGVTQVCVDANAVITPAVRDELKQQKIALNTAAAPGHSAGHSAGNSAANSDASTLSLVVASSVAGLVLNDFLSGSVLPVGGTIQKLENACPLASIERMVELTGPNVLGVLITERSALALCVANRHPQLRAALVADVEQVRQSAAELGANVIVINPVQKTTFQIRNLLRTFVAVAPRACPVAHPLLKG